MGDFEIESSIPRFLPYTMADGKHPPLLAVQLYVHLPFVWPLLGKQFLLTGTKASNKSVQATA